MKNKVRVVVVPVGDEPFEARIDPGLDAMQRVVAGYIEAVPLERGVQLICNEEGKLLGLPMNRRVAAIKDVICGDFLISRVGSEGEAVDLTDIDVAAYTNMFALRPRYAHA
jgi:hypothetical protein